MNGVFTKILSSRKVWIALGSLALAVGAVVGFNPDKSEKIVNAIEVFAGTVIVAAGLEDAGEKLGNGGSAGGDTTIVNAPSAIAPAPSGDSNASGASNAVNQTLKLVPFLLLPVVLFCAAGCSLPGDAQAEQSTYNAIAPEYQQYFEADAKLSPEQKQRRENTLATWKMRIDHNLPATQPAN